MVGVIGNSHRIENRFPVQIVGERNLRAVAEVSGAVPLMFASIPEITDVGALLDVVDGIVLTGARANVHPTRFNTTAPTWLPRAATGSSPPSARASPEGARRCSPTSTNTPCMSCATSTSAAPTSSIRRPRWPASPAATGARSSSIGPVRPRFAHTP